MSLFLHCYNIEDRLTVKLKIVLDWCNQIKHYLLAIIVFCAEGIFTHRSVCGWLWNCVPLFVYWRAKCYTGMHVCYVLCWHIMNRVLKFSTNCTDYMIKCYYQWVYILVHFGNYNYCDRRSSLKVYLLWILVLIDDAYDFVDISLLMRLFSWSLPLCFSVVIDVYLVLSQPVCNFIIMSRKLLSTNWQSKETLPTFFYSQPSRHWLHSNDIK